MGAFGCGDDDGDDGSANVDADMTDDDADPDEVDASPPGACDLTTLAAAGEGCPEGGEVRLEYVRWTDGSGPGGRTHGTRATAFGLTHTDPESIPFPVIETCYNLLEDGVWPRTQPAERSYATLGNVVFTGGPSALTVMPASPATRDTFFRTHAAWNFSFGIDDTDTYITPNSLYTVYMTGSGSWPGQVYTNAIMIPEEYEVTSHLTAFELVPDEDMEVTWTVETTDNPEGFREIVLVGFTGAMGPTGICLGMNDGAITIPAELINEVIAFNVPGVFSRQVISHNTAELSNGDDVMGRRLDLVGVWCYVTPFTIPAP